MTERTKIHILSYLIFFLGLYFCYKLYVVFYATELEEIIDYEYSQNLYNLKQEKKILKEEYEQLKFIIDEKN